MHTAITRQQNACAFQDLAKSFQFKTTSWGLQIELTDSYECKELARLRLHTIALLHV